MTTKLKICGLYRDEDIAMVNQCLPDYVGFILNVPKSHRNVTPEQVRAWKEQLSPKIKIVGVFVDQEPQYIAQIAPSLDVIQLHGDEGVMKLAILEHLCPGKEIWKAFAVKTAQDVQTALAFPAHKILLDYGKGEGKPFDWSILEGITQPYILAGGISPQNVSQALSLCHPSIVDLSSGVETDKKKDMEKIKQLCKEMNR